MDLHPVTGLPIYTDADNPREYQFAACRFNADTGDLRDAQGTTRLEPQVAKLLAYFLGNQQRVISRDELIASVWGSRVVSDDAINRCISILRQTLSPQDTHAYIETVTRRGYLAHFPPAPEHESPEPTSSRRGYWLWVALLGIAVVAISLSIVMLARTAGEKSEVSAERPRVIAVLPFSASGQGDDGRFFANGVHDDLLTQLAQLQALRVISRTSVLEYRDRNQNLREVGRELGADAILEGSVQGIGEQIRINVQLIDAQTDEHLWAQSYDRKLSPGNLFAVQSEIAHAIASATNTRLTAQEASRLAVLPTENMAAYRAYHQAMELRDSVTISDPSYVDALERAVTLDPKFVRAWAELAGVLSYQHFSLRGGDKVERIEQIIDRIHALAPDSADGLIAQAYYTYYVLKDYGQAQKLIAQAHRTRPSDVRLLELKAWIERRIGDVDARSESLRLARTLDPRNPRWTNAVLNNLMMAHRYDEAIREAESSGAQHYELAEMASRLRVRHHRDFARWAADAAGLQREFGGAADPWDLWDALIANREFTAAEALVRQLPDDYQRNDGRVLTDLRSKVYYETLSHWFLQQDHRLGEQRIRLQRHLDELRNPDGSLAYEYQILIEALISAAGGDAAETEHAVRRWQRAAVRDQAELSAGRHISCRLLGMAAAAVAAAECIRAALEEPSLAMPFVEPWLPYYDSIRDEPAFVDLLAGLSQGR